MTNPTQPAISDWRGEKKPGMFRPPSDEAMAHAPVAVRDAMALYQRVETARAEAAATLNEAKETLRTARDRLVSASVSMLLEGGPPAPLPNVRDFEDAVETAERLNAASNIASYEARQRLRSVLAGKAGKDWIARVGESSAEACTELLNVVDRIEALLPDAARMISTARFVNGSALSGAGRLLWIDAAIEMPIFDGRGNMTSTLRARDVLRDLRTLVAEIEGAIHPTAEGDDDEDAPSPMAEPEDRLSPDEGDTATSSSRTTVEPTPAIVIE